MVNPKNIIRKIVLGTGLVASLALTTSCEGVSHPVNRVETYPVDQIFRDHNGYRTFYTGDNHEIIERKYFTHSPLDPEPKIPIMHTYSDLFLDEGDNSSLVKIFKDLESGERGVANIAYFDVETPMMLHEVMYVEIHLPKDKSLSPGTESFGVKFPIHSNMGEIK